MSPRARPWLRDPHLAGALLLAIVMVAIQAAGEPAALWLRYEPAAIRAGEVWRLLSGHLVHLGWIHLALNLAALGVLALALPATRGLAALAAASAALMLATSAGLLLGSPEVVWYVGFSGVLHGLVVLAAGALWPGRRLVAALLVAGVALKVVWEQATGGDPALAAAIGGSVIVDAHLYGALGGGALLAAQALLRRR